jgi:hypothetical protein
VASSRDRATGTVWFQSVSNASNSFWDDDLARNFGYEEFYSPETMNTQGYQVTNSFGYEEEVMLGPSESWLANNGHNGALLSPVLHRHGALRLRLRAQPLRVRALLRK